MGRPLAGRRAPALCCCGLSHVADIGKKYMTLEQMAFSLCHQSPVSNTDRATCMLGCM